MPKTKVKFSEMGIEDKIDAFMATISLLDPEPHQAVVMGQAKSEEVDSGATKDRSRDAVTIVACDECSILWVYFGKLPEGHWYLGRNILGNVPMVTCRTCKGEHLVMQSRAIHMAKVGHAEKHVSQVEAGEEVDSGAIQPKPDQN